MDRLDDVEQAIVDTVREFVDREVRPVVRELEHADTWPSAAGNAASAPRCRR
jgi:acyl-CoA dehydrogenase-like protein